MKMRFHPHRFTISALLSLCLFGCDPTVINGIGAGAGGSGSGSGSSSGGAGGSGRSSGSNGGTGGSVSSGATNGGPEFCRSTALGNNTPVTIHVRNTGATDLGVLDGMCGATSWSLTSPDGGRLPSEYDFLCDGSSEACPGICDGFSFSPIPAGAETTFVWDGILSQDVNLDASKECPAAETDGDGCSFKGCQRHLDAAPGSYTVEVHAYNWDDDRGYDIEGGIEKTVTFNYPEQTDVDVVFP
ncbi:hypothetical protein [Sorangium sp. So ce1099]|uniref:hypothetical protein n=1 Tax=Sorangium sp. So ce1099 TaxID=3133331 RepID=UPI003F5EF50D